jgi:hypothetical protein
VSGTEKFRLPKAANKLKGCKKLAELPLGGCANKIVKAVTLVML